MTQWHMVYSHMNWHNHALENLNVENWLVHAQIEKMVEKLPVQRERNMEKVLIEMLLTATTIPATTTTTTTMIIIIITFPRPIQINE